MVEVGGLENVVAVDSSICYIDGDRGILSYRGIDIHELAQKSSFEEVCFLLWEGRLPRRDELEEMRAGIGAERAIPRELLSLLATLARTSIPMDALRTTVSALVDSDPDGREMSEPANRRKARRLTGQLATIVAAFHRLRSGKAVVPPDPGRAHADDFLRMLNGETARSAAVRALDIALTLHADHELNASTFAARVTAATLSDIHSSITSAIGALKGPLHGGANEDVIKLLLKAGDPDRAASMAREILGQGKKIPGFGHRVYRTEDPRATHLRVLSEELGKRTGHTALYQESQRVEQTIRTEKKLNANVDFYSASTYYSLGIPPDLFTPVFAVSRMSGWTAHVLEQYANNRLIRPRAEYRGNPDGMAWVPIEAR